MVQTRRSPQNGEDHMKAQDIFTDRSAALSRSPEKRSRYIPRRQAADLCDIKKGATATETALGGCWSFRLFKGISEIDDRLLEREAPLDDFEKIDLPAAIKRSDILPFCFPDIPDTAETALFCRDIDIAEPCSPTYLVLEGFSGNLALFINSEPAGFAMGDGNLCEFDITRFLTAGKNRFCILLRSVCEQSFLLSENRQEYFGITEPFYLLSRSKGHITDLSLCSSLSEDFCNGTVTATLFGDYLGDADFRLFDREGKEVCRGGFDENGQAAASVRMPDLWSTEQPDLYLFEAEAGGEFIYKYIGFKQIDFDLNEGMRLNGRKFRFHGGVYSADFKSAEQIGQEILTLKQNHINALAIEGNSSQSLLLSLCDKYGILAVCDIGIGTDGFDRNNNRRIYDDGTLFPLIEEKIVGRVSGIKSYTCLAGIAFFGFCGDGKNVYNSISLVKELSRLPVFYAGDPADTVRTTEFDQRPDIYFTDGSLKCFDDPFAGKKPVAVIGRASETDDCRILGQFDPAPLDRLSEIKAAFPFFKVDEIDACSGDFYITNLFSFSYLSRLECSFEVTCRGKVTAKGFVGALPLSPGRCEKVHIDYELPRGDENYVRFEFKRLGDCKWAKDGFSEGSVQFKLPDGGGLYGEKEPDRPSNSDKNAFEGPDCRIEQTGGRIIFSGRDFKYVFRNLTGCFERLEHRGKPLVLSPLSLKLSCDRPLFPAFCSSELSIDGDIAVIRSEITYMADRQKGKESLVAVWSVDKKGKITLDCSLPSGDFDCFGPGLSMTLDCADFTYFGMGEHSGYTGIFKTEGDARRRIRSCLFNKTNRPFCVFCTDRITVETNRHEATFFAGREGEGNAPCELSLSICPDREGRLLFE